VKAVRNPVRRH